MERGVEILYYTSFVIFINQHISMTTIR